VEVIEGGVGGTSLLPYFQDNIPTLIVDYGTKNMPKVMTQDDIGKLDIHTFDHANAFLYLLKSLKCKYTLYLAQEEFQEDNLDIYVEEIRKLIEEIQK
jgi:Ni,Fe-hydrogenase maturation factor